MKYILSAIVLAILPLSLSAQTVLTCFPGASERFYSDSKTYIANRIEKMDYDFEVKPAERFYARVYWHFIFVSHFWDTNNIYQILDKQFREGEFSDALLLQTKFLGADRAVINECNEMNNKIIFGKFDELLNKVDVLLENIGFDALEYLYFRARD